VIRGFPQLADMAARPVQSPRWPGRAAGNIHAPVAEVIGHDEANLHATIV